MLKKYLLLILILFFNSYSQVLVTEDSVYSPSIKSYCRISVLVPDGYTKGHGRYTALYLLHGFNQNHTHWFNSNHLIQTAKAYPYIIITFDADNSWFTNSATQNNSNYEDLFVKDLIPFIDKKYRTIADKQHRAIAGLSMGGYGAIKFGIKYPEKFCYVAGLSPSIQFPAGLEDSAIVSRRSAASNKSVRDAFGAQRNEHWNENDIFFLLEKSSSVNMPYFYLSVGSQDGIPEIIERTHEFAGVLRKKGLSFEMHETIGSHDWKFWDKEIEIVLKKITEQIN